MGSTNPQSGLGLLVELPDGYSCHAVNAITAGYGCKVARLSWLAAANRAPFLKERRIRNPRCVRAANRRLASCWHRGHGERHGNSMVAKRIQLGAMQMLAATNPHSIGTLFNFRAHLSQIFRSE